MLWNQISWLHKNLPYPLLKLWGSSDRIVSLTSKLALGGNKHIEYYNLLKRMQNWSTDKLYDFQYKKLRELLQHAYTNVPFYKDLFVKGDLKPHDIRCLEDLKKIPIIDKKDIINNSDNFFPDNINNGYVLRETSGTSGTSTKFYLDANVLSALRANALYFRSILGYIPGKDIVLHTPIFNSVKFVFSADRLRFGYYTPLTKQVILPVESFQDKYFNRYLMIIKKYKIERAEGLPSVFFAFAKYLERKNRNIKIKTVALGGEVLYDFQKRLIEERLGCKVFNYYASVESTIVAFECKEREGMHISPFGIGGRDDGSLSGKGRLVMTNLMNYKFPLIRYTTGDDVSLTKKKCKCGCVFPRIMNVEGRSNDFVIFPNGTYVPPSQLAWSTVLVPGIKDIYFLQHEDYSLEILVVKEENVDKYRIVNGLKKRMKEISKNKKRKLKYKILFKDNIERRSHKFRVVETKVKDDINTKT